MASVAGSFHATCKKGTVVKYSGGVRVAECSLDTSDVDEFLFHMAETHNAKPSQIKGDSTRAFGLPIRAKGATAGRSTWPVDLVDTWVQLDDGKTGQVWCRARAPRTWVVADGEKFHYLTERELVPVSRTKGAA